MHAYPATTACLLLWRGLGAAKASWIGCGSSRRSAPGDATSPRPSRPRASVKISSALQAQLDVPSPHIGSRGRVPARFDGATHLLAGAIFALHGCSPFNSPSRGCACAAAACWSPRRRRHRPEALFSCWQARLLQTLNDGRQQAEWPRYKLGKGELVDKRAVPRRIGPSFAASSRWPT